MCCPNYSLWVEEGSALTVFGECHHSKILDLTHEQSYSVGFPGSIHRIPFESIIYQSRDICWQPQNQLPFYPLKHLPTKEDFAVAQAKMDEEIGDSDKLIKWFWAVSEKAEDDEFWSSQGNTPSVYGAMRRVLSNQKPFDKRTKYEPIRVLPQAPHPGQVISLTEPIEFTLPKKQPKDNVLTVWSELFSERKNRIELWK